MHETANIPKSAAAGTPPASFERLLLLALSCALTAALSGSPVPAAAIASPQTAATPWHLSGNLSEACTCSVPCTCNFGADPSPEHFCYALFSLDIAKGNYGKVRLDGLRLAGASAAKGTLWYVDERATQEQGAALEKIADLMHDKLVGFWRGVDPKMLEDPQFNSLGFRRAKIVQQYSANKNLLKLGDAGGFDSDYILGMDGKTPVLVENNWSWNISHGIKGKTNELKYKDEFGNSIDLKGTNANQGKFDWTDKTAIYFR
jgi:hypothetical protein